MLLYHIFRFSHDPSSGLRQSQTYYYIKFVKGRKPRDEDMDFFDDEGYEEEPYINEDDAPQIAEDAETDGDED